GRPWTLAIAGHELVGGAYWVGTFSRDNAALTPDDLAAFAWIREHTPAGAVFANNPGDGGALLPAAIHRKVFDPHFYWFFDEAEMAAWRAKTPIDYVYVGARSGPAWPVRWKNDALGAEPGVEEGFRSGAGGVYRGLKPLDPRWR